MTAPRSLSSLVSDALDSFELATDGASFAPLAIKGERSSMVGDRPLPASFAILLANDRVSCEVLVRALLAGCHVVSIPRRPTGMAWSAYGSWVGARMRECLVSTLVLPDEILHRLSPDGFEIVALSSCVNRKVDVGGGFRLTQFSSGTTGPPHPVTVSDAELGINVTATLSRLEPDAADVAVSWLPLSHDMGLIGMFFGSLTAASAAFGGASRLRLLEPARFVKSPQSWFAAIAECRGTFTAAPDFAYRHMSAVGGSSSFDLRSVRVAICGGELVRSSTLSEFCDSFGRLGFSGRAFCPAYGLAEVGVAASLVGASEEWHVEHLAYSDAGGGSSSRGSELVSCGSPLDGYVVKAEWDGQYNQLLVSTPSGCSVATSDVGLVVDSEVFPAGRLDDFVTVRGRNVHAPSVEHSILRSFPELRRVALVIDRGGDVVLAVACARSVRREGGLSDSELNRALSSLIGARPDRIVRLRSQMFPMTASGKLRRRDLAGLVSLGGEAEYLAGLA